VGVDVAVDGTGVDVRVGVGGTGVDVDVDVAVGGTAVNVAVGGIGVNVGVGVKVFVAVGVKVSVAVGVEVGSGTSTSTRRSRQLSTPRSTPRTARTLFCVFKMISGALNMNSSRAGQFSCCTSPPEMSSPLRKTSTSLSIATITLRLKAPGGKSKLLLSTISESTGQFVFTVD
jgi:hypothetical protein